MQANRSKSSTSIESDHIAGRGQVSDVHDITSVRQPIERAEVDQQHMEDRRVIL